MARLLYATKFKKLSHNLIEKFSDEIGVSTIKQYTGDSYDPVTGTTIPVYNEVQCLVAYTGIKAGEDYTQTYRHDHGVAIISGEDISFVPADGDTVIKPDGKHYRIVNVITDQYDAAFFCHYNKKPL